MIIKGISIRSKLLITTLVIIFMLVTLSLVIMDTSNRMVSSRGLLNQRSEMIEQLLILEHSFHSFVRERDPQILARCISDANRLETSINTLAAHSSLEGEDPALHYARRAGTYAGLLVDELSFRESTDSSSWERAETELLALGELLMQFNAAITSMENRSIGSQKRQMVIVLSLGIFFIGFFLILFTFNLNRTFRSLISFTRKLRKGILPLPLVFTQGDEVKKVAEDLNAHIDDLQTKIRHITSLSSDKPVDNYKPGEEDEMGSALLVLSDYLIKKELNEITRNREDKKQNWISDGMAKIGNVLRSERENVVVLSYSIIQKLISYMNLEMGALYISNYNDPDKPLLELIASYAYDRQKYLSSTLEWGSGLPGTCAQEKKRIFLTEVPEHYFEVSSGTGSARPNCLLLVPMIVDEQVFGIIELATLHLLRPFEIEFVESLAEEIASTLMAVRNNEQTTKLLNQSRAQADTLKSQETILKENMKQLEQAQSESNKKETEITGILNAINQSTLVAELGLNGRFTSINEQFLIVLESHSDQVLGKLYTEFSQADPSSDEYRNFWSSLKEGNSTSNTELYKLVSGKEIWLRQTFTPIINQEGKVYKILNIAENITETRILQGKLESHENEIERAGLDLQSLHEAVNSALIKCELDSKGIIMQVNDKYSEIAGYSRKELLGRNYRLFLQDSERAQFEKIWEEVSKKKVYEGVIRRSRPTGEETWMIATFSPVIDENDLLYKIYFMGLDITEKKLKYQLLEDANEEIERMKQQLQKFQNG